MSSRPHHLVAIDLGATSGRVVLGTVEEERLSNQIVHRFTHEPHFLDAHLRWDWPGIIDNMREGLRAALDAVPKRRIDSISCSTWAQDFGLLNEAGDLITSPVSYRDARTQGMPDSFADAISPEQLVARAGCCKSPVTCLCQLRALAMQDSHLLRQARTLLFMADLVHHALCGSRTTDFTMVSASQLRNLRTGQWDRELLDHLAIPHHFLPTIVDAPQIIGRIPAENGIDPRLAGVPVISTAGHDTAAAAACLPPDPGHACLSLGTWAMLGCRTSAPVIPPDVAAQGWTILGLPESTWGLFISGTGLWLIEECRRQWEMSNRQFSHDELIGLAECASIESRIDPNATCLSAPANMLEAIQQACKATNQQLPREPGEFARVIFNSLVDCYSAAFRRFGDVLPSPPTDLRIVGGGTRNKHLCGKIAAQLDVPVHWGPAEATAVGNLLLQAKVLGLAVSSST